MQFIKHENMRPSWYFSRDEVKLILWALQREFSRWVEIINSNEDPVAEESYSEDAMTLESLVEALEYIEDEGLDPARLDFSVKDSAYLLKALNYECTLSQMKTLSISDIDTELLLKVRGEFCSTAESAFGELIYRYAYYDRSHRNNPY